MHLASHIPGIRLSALPAEEHEHAQFVSANFMQLFDCVEGLRSGLSLFGFAAANQKTQADADARAMIRRWGTIGGREGALAIYAFYQVEQELNGRIRKCPTLVPHVDFDAYKAARVEFLTAFPDFGDLRTAAAHPGELGSTPEKAQLNSAKGIVGDGFSVDPEVAMFVSSGVMGNRYVCTFKGKQVGYDMTAETLSTLEGVFLKICAAFSGIETVGET